MNKIEMNIWDDNFDEVVDFIKKASIQIDEKYEENSHTLKKGCIDWMWIKNMRCKYISLRIDMRDGTFIILDRDGNRISFDDLKRQR